MNQHKRNLGTHILLLSSESIVCIVERSVMSKKIPKLLHGDLYTNADHKYLQKDSRSYKEYMLGICSERNDEWSDEIQV